MRISPRGSTWRGRGFDSPGTILPGWKSAARLFHERALEAAAGAWQVFRGTKYGVPSTEYRVLKWRHLVRGTSVLWILGSGDRRVGTGYSVLGTPYSVLGTRYSVLGT